MHFHREFNFILYSLCLVVETSGLLCCVSHVCLTVMSCVGRDSNIATLALPSCKINCIKTHKMVRHQSFMLNL